MRPTILERKEANGVLRGDLSPYIAATQQNCRENPLANQDISQPLCSIRYTWWKNVAVPIKGGDKYPKDATQNNGSRVISVLVHCREDSCISTFDWF